LRTKGHGVKLTRDEIYTEREMDPFLNAIRVCFRQDREPDVENMNRV
jgi:hypothetical protein